MDARTENRLYHYNDVIMTTMASQITSLTVVYSIVYSGVDQRKHQSSASLAFVRGNHRDRWIPRTKGQLRGKCFHLMTSSCISRYNKIYSKILWDKCNSLSWIVIIQTAFDNPLTIKISDEIQSSCFLCPTPLIYSHLHFPNIHRALPLCELAS